MIIKFQYDYKKLLEYIYDNARWEAYYDPAIIPILSFCCEEAGVKVVPVHETRKSGRPNKDQNKKKHFIETYSVTKQAIVKKNGIKKQVARRVGIPDFVVVPNDSSYDDPMPSIVNVEFKLPSGLTTDYHECNPNDHVIEIKHQLELCDFLIFTDGVTWFFIRNGEGNKDFHIDKSITLYDQANGKWKIAYRTKYSDSEKEFFKSIDIAFDDNEKVECAPPEWCELMEEIKHFIRKGIEDYEKRHGHLLCT